MSRLGFRTVAPLVAILLAPVWLAACSPGRTYGTGQAPEVAMFREMSGGLFGGEKKKPIEYQPRAPLVVPPDSDQLPPPAEGAVATAQNWPADPSERVVARAGADREDERSGASQAEYRRLKPLVGVLPETPDDGWSASPYEIVRHKKQSQEFRKKLAEANGYGQGERRMLVDPPQTYRTPAATAPAKFEDINADDGGGGGGWFGWLFARRH